MPINVAIVGCGEIAIDQHIPAIRQWSNRIKVVAVIDIEIGKAENIGKQLKVQSFRSLEDAMIYNNTLIEKDRFDTVILLLPHYLHKEYALKILNTGQYHLLLEKPIAMNLKEARELIEAARKTKKVFLVAENAPHWPEIVKMDELIRSKAIGDLITIIGYLNYPLPNKAKAASDANDWRSQLKLAGGGIISDGGLHWIRVLRVLMGEEAISVSSAFTARTLSHMEGESFGHAIIKFKSGKNAIFTMAILTQYVGEYNLFEAIGSKGHLILKSGPKGSIGYYNERNTKLILYNKDHPDGIEVMKPQGYSQSFVEEYGNFLDAIEYNKPLKVTPESTAQDLSIAFTIYHSAQLKQEVAIPSIHSVYEGSLSTFYAKSRKPLTHDSINSNPSCVLKSRL
jgi:UDP-N-acetyl-2-amino-2-deoxyglucuronate dehydrogenase